MKKENILVYSDLSTVHKVHCYESVVEINMSGFVTLFELDWDEEKDGVETTTEKGMFCVSAHSAERLAVIFAEMTFHLRIKEEKQRKAYHDKEAAKAKKKKAEAKKPKLAKKVNSKVAKAKVASKKLPRAAKIAEKVAK